MSTTTAVVDVNPADRHQDDPVGHKNGWRRRLTWAPSYGVTSTRSAVDEDSTSTSSSSWKLSRRMRGLSGFWKKSASLTLNEHRRREPERNFDDGSIHFFKEERTDDAVYNVYLKKVQYHIDSDTSCLDSSQADTDAAGDENHVRHHRLSGSSQTSNSRTSTSDAPGGLDDRPNDEGGGGSGAADDDDDDRRAHLQWRLEEVRVIKYGTLGRLVAALSSDTGQLEVTNVNTFLTTCRTFASTSAVVDELIKRYNEVSVDSLMKQEVKDGHKRTLRTVISAWLDTYPDDFRDPPTYAALLALRRFVADQLPSGDDLAQKVTERLTLFQTEDARPQIVVSSSTGDVPAVGGRNSSEDRRRLVEDFNANYASSKTLGADFLAMSSRHVAEQLTYMDAELFKKVVPQQCLGSVWSRRSSGPARPMTAGGGGRTQLDSVATVSATVNQFNAVTYRVISTIVGRVPASGGHSRRVQIVEKWIDIAQECRRLKNFSSLKAILSGLQCTPVYRLRKLWNAVSKQKLTLFDELSAIFSEANNQQTWREVLNKEGTAKFANDTQTASTLKSYKKSWMWNSKRLQRSKSLDGNCTPGIQGTVPYLGTFLTDLMMVDTAFRDTTDGGLINFDKRRREFEILTQIKLYQSAAALYRLSPDPRFADWFNGVQTFDDNESYELSCEIEPDAPAQVTPPCKLRLKKLSCSSFSYLSPRRRSSSTISSSFDDLGSSTGTVCPMTSKSRSCTLRMPPSKDFHIADVSAAAVKDASNDHRLLRHSISAGSLLSPHGVARSPRSSTELVDSALTSRLRSRDRLVVKVFLETSESHEAVHYKSILMVNSDRTHAVLRNVLMKFDVVAKPEDYLIFQLLQDGSELALPENGNIFYAVNTTVPDLRFIVRRKCSGERPASTDGQQQQHDRSCWKKRTSMWS